MSLLLGWCWGWSVELLLVGIVAPVLPVSRGVYRPYFFQMGRMGRVIFGWAMVLVLVVMVLALVVVMVMVVVTGGVVLVVIVVDPVVVVVGVAEVELVLV